MRQKKVKLLLGHRTMGIEPGELKGVKPGEWLNDEVVNAYVELIKQVATPDVILLSSFFMSKLAKGYNVERDWKRVSHLLFHVKFISSCFGFKQSNGKGFYSGKASKVVLPISEPLDRGESDSGSHWTMAVIDCRRQEVLYINSYKELSEFGRLKEVSVNCCLSMNAYIMLQ